jgi:putative glutamine amidotransferase
MTGIRQGAPLIAVICCGGTMIGRDMQFLANRFLQPLADVGACAMLVPTMASVVDARAIATRCDGLLLTGSATNVSPRRYGSDAAEIDADHGRDEVAMAVGEAMIAAGRPVLGICRGMQELNVLHGGSLTVLDDEAGIHMRKADWTDPHILEHSHDVDLVGTHLRGLAGEGRIPVASIHRQGIARLARDLVLEATAPDGIVEAFSGSGGRVVGVQWHPELMRSRLDRALFENLARAA